MRHLLPLALLALTSLLLSCAPCNCPCETTPSSETSGGEGAPAAAAISDTPLPPEPANDIVRMRVPVTETQPQLGTPDALVTIVQFSEFQCPFCQRVRPTLERIVRDYGGQVRIVWRNNPLAFHQSADPAAQVAMEAFEQGGHDAFWRIHDILFANQSNLERPQLLQYAAQAGLDVLSVQQALDSREHAGVIAADQALANQVGARGTPNFFINGRQVAGAQPYERFKEIIDEELAYARRALEAGIPASQLYARLMQDARTAPPPPAAPAEQQRRRRPDPDAIYRLTLGSEPLPQRGPDDALVTIVQFSDFECPFCSRVEPTLDQVIDEFGNDVRVIWMNNPLPFHRNALPAANFALAAFDQGGNEAFWRAHELLFQNQRSLDRASLERFAQQLQLDGRATMEAVDDNHFRATIEAQQRIARQLGATGTPSFFINGRNLRGAQPYERFAEMIRAELTRARSLVDGGVARADVYAAAIRDGATEAQYVEEAAPAPAPSRPDPDQVYTIAVPSDAPQRGPDSAAVTIQMFSDFQCPFCSRVNPTVDQILDHYGTSVRVVWRDYPLPFHRNAHLAAEAAREVFRQRGNDAFWRYHEQLFANQRSLERPTLERLAQQEQVDMAAFRQALDDRTHRAAVDADMDAVRAAGARIGTPSFFINGRLVQGAQPFEAFRAAIDRALREAGQTP